MRESQRAVRVRPNSVPGDPNTGAFDGMRVLATETAMAEPTASRSPGLHGVELGGVACKAFGGTRS
jgi:hypothetical protein